MNLFVEQMPVFFQIRFTLNSKEILMMKRPISILTCVFALGLTASSYANEAPVTQEGYIKGTLAVNWDTRLSQNREGDYPKAGVADTFTYDVTVGHTTYKGNLECKPYIFSKHLGRVVQVGDCKYDINVGVINPANPSQSKTVGKIVGNYAIDQEGQVNLSEATVRMEVQSIGQAQALTSKYTGIFSGKAPQAETTLKRLREEAVKKSATITRMVGQKSVSVTLGDVDPLKFQNTGLPAGPSANYPQATVNGELIYSYESDNWFPQFTLSYGDTKDSFGGGIKWVEESESVGRYSLNIILNEGQAGLADEAAAFNEDVQGEDAFFITDPAQSVMNGSIEFRDTAGGVDNLPRKTDISFNIGVQQVTAQQALAFWKLMLLVPNQMYGE
jgi:hypothetical protein